MTPVLTVTLPPPPFRMAEALRYAGARPGDAATERALCEVYAEAAPLLSYTVLYRELPISISGTRVTLGPLTVTSQTLATCLAGAERALLIATTLGPRLDRLLARTMRISLARALLLQGIGAERVEALLDAFSDRMRKEYGAKAARRVSPGYGDLPLALQSDIFPLLDCERRLGLTLGDMLLMSPSKSVTAFLGIQG